MLNIGIYKHMTPERYVRYLGLLRKLLGLSSDRTYAVRELYQHLDPEDRDGGARQALMKRLRGDKVLRRMTGHPIRYALQPTNIARAYATLVRELLWHGHLKDTDLGTTVPASLPAH